MVSSHFSFQDIKTKDIINITICDFRGTNNEDAGPDLIIPYVAYVISDVIIINESKMIFNSTLKNLESTATYVNEIRNTVKDISNKHLLFRIADFQGKHPDEIIPKLLN